MLGGLFGRRRESKPDLALDPGFDAIINKLPATPKASPAPLVPFASADADEAGAAGDTPAGIDPVKMLAAVMAHPEDAGAAAPPGKKAKTAAPASKAHRRTQSSMPSLGTAMTAANPLVGSGEEADPVKMLGDVISGGKSKLKKTNLLEKLMSGTTTKDAAPSEATSLPSSPEKHRRAFSESVVDCLADTWELMIMKESANYLHRVEYAMGTAFDAEYEAERKERSTRMAKYLSRTTVVKEAKEKEPVMSIEPVASPVLEKKRTESFSDKRARASSVSSIPEDREEGPPPEPSSNSSSEAKALIDSATTSRKSSLESPKKLRSRSSDSASMSISVAAPAPADIVHTTPTPRKLVTRKSSGTAMKMADVKEKPALESRLSASRGSVTTASNSAAIAAARAHRRARSSISMGDARLISTYVPDSFDMLVDKKKVVLAVADKGTSETKTDWCGDDYFPEK